MSKFDTIGLINQSTLPSAVAGDVVFQASKLRVFNGSTWETFSAVNPSGQSNTITMGGSQQFLAEGGAGNPNDGAPSYAFSGDTDTGIWNPADGRMRFAVNGSGSMELDNDGMELLMGAFQAPLGAPGTPSYSFTGDGNTGMWSPGADQIAFGVGSITSALSIGSTGVLNVGASNYETLISNPNDIPNKAYVDGIAAGLDPKQAVRVATASVSEDLTLAPYNGSFSSSGGSHGNGSITGIDLSVGTGGTIDGANYTNVPATGLADGDRILIKDQGAALQNGIYIILAGSITTSVNMERAPDQDGSPTNEISGGNFTFVEDGATLAGTLWTIVWPGDINLNVDPINWSQIGAALSFPVLAPTGAAPQYSYAGDTDTGMASPSADVLNLIAGNTIGLQFTSAGPQLAANLNVNDLDIVGKPAVNATSPGGNIDILAANGGATSGAGGNIAITAGTGFGTEGGDITITAGAGDTGINAGDILLSGGVPSGGGSPSSLTLNGGFSSGVGGALILQGGSGLTGFDGGAVDITSGTSAGGAGGGGAFTLTSGGAAGSGAGADLALRPGGSASGTNGHVTIRRSSTTGDTPQFRLHELFSNGSDYIGLKAPDSVVTSVTYALPLAGVEGQHLKLGASDAMEWDSNEAVLSVQTTDDTETELVGPGTTYYTIASGTTHAIEILVVAEKSDGSEAAMWKVLVGIKNVAGTTSIVGADVTTTVSNTPGWVLAVSADDTNDRLAVKVTGVAATTIDWKARITAVQV